MSLFQSAHLNDVLSARLRAAAAKVSALSHADLCNPALAGTIEGIWAEHRPDVPTIYPTQKHGTKRQTTQHREDYGRHITVDVTYVDVSIPFRGDGEMFKCLPSSSKIIQEDIAVGHDHLLYSVPLDRADGGKIDALLADVEGNLKTMRADVEAFDKKAISELSQLAVQRKARLDDDTAKAKKLGFPVN
jgi:hypothetical protein